MANLFLGVDWGTHSSKWCCLVGSTHEYMSTIPIFGSELIRQGENLVFSPPPEQIDDDTVIRALKHVLIDDPLGSHFWNSVRQDTETSLGEAVCFSLCCLLGDAKRRIQGELGPGDSWSIQVGFSFPNWLVNRNRKFRVAANNFQQAVRVAITLFARIPAGALPQPGIGFPAYCFQEMVRPVRSEEIVKPQPNLEVEGLTQNVFEVPNSDVTWGFLTESGAAGLPYLRALELVGVPGVPGLAKVLVIDVGAGSTDVGYMLRVMNRETQKEGLYFFEPADSLPLAGNYLTESILKHQSTKGQTMPWSQAERMKLQATGWHDLPFVDVWRSQVCEHVRQYVQDIPDERWLPLPVSLNVVVTGGSGLVPKLKDSLRESIKSALASRGADLTTQQMVRLPGEHIPHLSFALEAEYARRAVCIGSADSEKPGIRFIEKMDPPTRVVIERPPSWV